MENILYNVSQVLAISIIHSLWEGLLIYALLRLVLMFSNQLSSVAKYWLAVSSQAAITIWFGCTLANEISIYNWLAVTPVSLSKMPLLIQLPSGIGQFNDQSIRYYYSIEAYLPYISLLYVSGLLFNSFRLLLARKKMNEIKQSISLDVTLQLKLNQFAGKLNITKKIIVGLHQMIDVPCMVGFFKPVILLPFSLATYLSPAEIEAILLHELAHIKRNDYLVNAAQQVISLLLFFNPCTQLINRIINEERENCCDDLVVKATADPIIYAKALLKLEQNRQNDWKQALAATGKKYHLLNRIERIMKTKKQTTSMRPALTAMLILTAGIGLVTLLSPQIAHGKISVKALSPAIHKLLADTNKNAPAKPPHQLNAKTNHPYKKTTYNGINDKKLEELTADINKHSRALSKYYSSSAFKTAQEELEKKGKEMQELYNSDSMKKMQDEIAKASADFAKDYSQDDKLKGIQDQMGEKGRRIGEYYSSAAFKRMNEELEKKYGIPHNHSYNDDQKDENYRKYQAELESKIPADVKLQQDELKKMGEQIGARYKSPEFKLKTERIKLMADSIQRAYQSPEMKEQQKEMAKLSRQMASFQNNPDIKREEAMLQESVRRMQEYINSPAYKSQLKQLKKMNFDYHYNFNYNDDNDKVEKTEKVEKPESNN